VRVFDAHDAVGHARRTKKRTTMQIVAGGHTGRANITSSRELTATKEFAPQIENPRGQAFLRFVFVAGAKAALISPHAERSQPPPACPECSRDAD